MNLSPAPAHFGPQPARSSTLAPKGPATPTQWLSARVKEQPGAPLLTYYDLARDERVELSAKTFANWVDKTVNLIDDCGYADQPQVLLDVVTSRPGHWVGLVWLMAIWQINGTAWINPSAISVDECNQAATPHPPAGSFDLAVTVPNHLGPLSGGNIDTTVACSLHPLGLGCQEDVSPALDYAEVLSQPDAHWTSAETTPRLRHCQGVPRFDPTTADQHWLDAFAHLAGSANPQGQGRRVLVSVHDLARTIIVADSHASGSPAESGAAFLVAVNTQALLQPLAQGGSAVIVTGTGGMDDEQRHRRLCDIASSERVWIDPDQEASPPR